MWIGGAGKKLKKDNERYQLRSNKTCNPCPENHNPDTSTIPSVPLPIITLPMKLKQAKIKKKKKNEKKVNKKTNGSGSACALYYPPWYNDRGKKISEI